MTRQLFLLIALTLLSLPTGAQTKRAQAAATLTATDAVVQSRDTLITIRFDLVVPPKAVRRNYRYTLLPSLIAPDSTYLRLTPIAVVGSRKERSERRKAVLGGRARSRNKQVDKYSAVADSTPYAITVPYADWMSDAPLTLRIDKCHQAYRDSLPVASKVVLTHIVIPSPWQPLVPPLRPQPRTAPYPGWMQESIVFGEQQQQNLLLPQPLALRIDFPLGATRLRTGWQRNPEQLATLKQGLAATDSLRPVVCISILGQARSDGDRLIEKRLSERRAQAVEKYLQRKAGMASARIEVIPYEPIDASLQKEVALSALTDTTPRTAHRYTKDHLLPGLQDAAYISVCYADREHPTQQYIARAIEWMNRGRYTDAIRLLQQAPTDPRTENLLGTAHLLTNADALTFLGGDLLIEPQEEQYRVWVKVVTPLLSTVAPELRPYIAPDSEYSADSARTAHERDSTILAVRYRVGSSQLLTSLPPNGTTLERIIEVVEQMKNAHWDVIRKIRIVGQASPEGGQAINEQLSMERAQTLKHYILAHAPLSEELFDVVSVGPAWQEFRALLAASDLKSKEDPQQYIREHIYPRLRNATYIKFYYDAAFDRNLPLINQAVALMRQGDYRGALPLLESVATDPHAALALGVALTLTGDAERGARYLKQAAAYRSTKQHKQQLP